MARAKVVHSEDACTIVLKGDKRHPEPSTCVIKFPGGFVEVSRTSRGEYWAHVYRDSESEISMSRVNYDHSVSGVPDIPNTDAIIGLSILIKKSRLDPSEVEP